MRDGVIIGRRESNIFWPCPIWHNADMALCGGSTDPAGVDNQRMVIIMFRPIHAIAFLLALLAGAFTVAQAAEVVVYKSPTCGCCNKWVDHLRENGFSVKTQDVADTGPYKVRAGITPALASCHTAFVDGYAIEGHVPADDIKRLLKERPKVQGLTVPGMPIGSPGMEQGSHKDKYEVLIFDKSGKTGVYSRH